MFVRVCGVCMCMCLYMSVGSGCFDNDNSYRELLRKSKSERRDKWILGDVINIPHTCVGPIMTDLMNEKYQLYYYDYKGKLKHQKNLQDGMHV